jgi:three-Cys-motif partner protein
MTLDRVGRWSIDKLDMLTGYASAYSVVMNAQKTPHNVRGVAWLHAYHYIDAFAGPGIALNKGDEEVRNYILGSPSRILRVEPRFDHMWLIDRNRARAQRLGVTLQAEGADPSRFTIQGGVDANTHISSLVNQFPSNVRALVFLDPYGLQVEWATVASLAASRKVDVLINFSLMGVIRNLRRVGGPDPRVRRLLDRVMQSTDWIDELYVQQGRLWDEPVAVRGQLAASAVAERYEADLKAVFSSVSEPAIMTNSRGSPIYALVFASQNQGAAPSIMRDMIRKAR